LATKTVTDLFQNPFIVATLLLNVTSTWRDFIFSSFCSTTEWEGRERGHVVSFQRELE